MEASDKNRRPLKSRDTRWAAAISRWLANSGVRPNQISIASAVFGAFAGVCFAFVPYAREITAIFLLIAAAVFMQCRLLCNLFDGMVAIEGGFRSKAGEIYNEFPTDLPTPSFLSGPGSLLDGRFAQPNSVGLPLSLPSSLLTYALLELWPALHSNSADQWPNSNAWP